MAPRLKILIASGSKKEPRYTLLVSQKSRQTNPLQVPQQGLYGEGGPLTGHFVYISKTSSFGFPSKGAPRRFSLWSSSQSDAPSLESTFFHLSKSPVYEPPPPHTRCPSAERVPQERDAPIRRPFQHIFQGPQ